MGRDNTDFDVPSAESKFDNSETLIDIAYETRVKGFLDELA